MRIGDQLDGELDDGAVHTGRASGATPEVLAEGPTRPVSSSAGTGAAATKAGAATAASALPATSSIPVILLERIEPALGRGERIRLDADAAPVRIGRAESNEIRLYTASASREHAVLAANATGEWILTPLPGRTVAVDGERGDAAVVLEAGMNLTLGGDRLRCLREEELSDPADAAAGTAPVSLAASARRPLAWMAGSPARRRVIAAGLLLAGAVCCWWLL